MLPARLEPRPSRCLAAALTALHALAAVAVGLAGLPWGLRGLLWGGLLVHLAWQLRRTRRPPVLLPAADRPWRLQAADGRQWSATLARARVWPLAVLLELRLETGATRHLLLCRDALPAEAHRRLRVALQARAAGRP